MFGFLACGQLPSDHVLTCWRASQIWGFDTKSKIEQVKSDQTEESLNSKVERQAMERENIVANHMSNKG